METDHRDVRDDIVDASDISFLYSICGDELQQVWSELGNGLYRTDIELWLSSRCWSWVSSDIILPRLRACLASYPLEPFLNFAARNLEKDNRG